jgi:hypothetical protein
MDLEGRFWSTTDWRPAPVCVPPFGRLRPRRPAWIVVALPSAPELTCRALSVDVDDILPPDDTPIS